MSAEEGKKHSLFGRVKKGQNAPSSPAKGQNDEPTGEVEGGSKGGSPPEQGAYDDKGRGCVAPSPLNNKLSCTSIHAETNETSLVDLYTEEYRMVTGANGKEKKVFLDPYERETEYIKKIGMCKSDSFLELSGSSNPLWMSETKMSIPDGIMSRLGYAVASYSGIRLTGSQLERLRDDLEDTAETIWHWETISYDRFIGFIEGWFKGVGLSVHLGNRKAYRQLTKDVREGFHSLPWTGESFDSPVFQFVRQRVIYHQAENYFSPNESTFGKAFSTKEAFALYKVVTKDSQKSNISFSRELSLAIQNIYCEQIRKGAVTSSENIKTTSLSKDVKRLRGYLGLRLILSNKEWHEVIKEVPTLKPYVPISHRSNTDKHR